MTRLNSDGRETAFPAGWRRWPVVKRLVPSLRKHWAALLWPDGQGTVHRDGAVFRIDYRHWLDQSILMRGAPERAQLSYLLENIAARDCAIFIDIGANSGIYSIFVAQRTRCKRILAFEPDRRSYDRLLANLLLNRLTDRVETHSVAVSDRNGAVPFVPGPATHNVLSKVGGGGEDSVSVAATRLDDALSVKGERIALKIDIEGHERTALDGMSALMKNNRCFVQVECFAQNAPGFIAAMEKRGYGLLHHIDHDYYFANF